MVIGYAGADAELDEISFIHRSVPYHTGRVEGSQTAILKMNKALLLESDQPLLSEGCMCHTEVQKRAAVE